MNEAEKLAEVLERERSALLFKWRDLVRSLPSARDLSDPTLNDHIPSFLDELACSLRLKANGTMDETPPEVRVSGHGLQRFNEHFDIAEVVTEYKLLRGCIHNLACDNHINLQGDPYHIINCTFDDAVGLAVQTYASQQALMVRKQREEYLSFVVHDLRAPLNAISLASVLIEDAQSRSKEADEETSSLIKILRNIVKTLNALVTNILRENISLMTEAGTEIHPRLFELWPFVEDLVNDLRPIASTANCSFVNEVPYDVTVCGDASLLQRVFRNLIANAIKYTTNGEVRIGAKKRGEDGAVECWVKDNGSGIPESRLNQVFKKLESDPNREDGTGLGLAVVEAFVKAHNREIAVQSKEGVGAEFQFVLPGPADSARSRIAA